MFHPGPNEVEWLADLKPMAEQIGGAVLGHSIRWRVETHVGRRRTRSDVLIENATTGALLLSGEAKRPDDPDGVHPLVTTVVDDAVAKAQAHGVPLCFTTNFHQVALLDAKVDTSEQPLLRLRGDLIDLLPREAANSERWWFNLDDQARLALVRNGLRQLFERYRLVTAGRTPTVHVDDVVLAFFAQLTNELVEPLLAGLLRRRDTLEASIRNRALVSGLDIKNDQDCRYLVAQGVAEVLSAVLFFRVLRDHFGDLGSMLDGTSPSTAATLAATVKTSLSRGQAVSGDYASILELSAVPRWTLSNSPTQLVGHWVGLIDFVDRLDLATVTSDVLGRIFERLISPDRRHEMGQHYTQPRLAQAMAEWGVTAPELTVLDPACGAGTFLVETYARHAGLGLSHDDILAKTFGNDLDAFAVHLASINLATRRIRHGLNHPRVRLGDAFDLRPGVEMVRVSPPSGADFTVPLPPVDLVIANPPYGRSHPDETTARVRVSALHEAALPATRGINMAAWFVLLAERLLNKGGSMAFVLPSAVLQNENLRQWRYWIRRRWDLVIWHTEDDVWFSDARVATCVILFKPRSTKSERLGATVFVNALRPATGKLAWFGNTPTPSPDCVVRDLSNLDGMDDLLVPGTLPNSLDVFASARNVAPLGAVEGVSAFAGQKLGHKFFKLSDLHPDRDTVLREVIGLDTTFRVNRSHLTPILVSPKDLEDGQPQLTRSWLLSLPPERPTSASIRGYLRLGVAQEVDRAPSVAGRSWWSISPKLFDVAVPMNGQFRHQTAWLEPKGAVTNNFNAITADDREAAELIAASLSSLFGGLSRLYISGEVGCEGARRVLLSQFVQWPVLDPAKVPRQLWGPCISAYKQWRTLQPSELDEMGPGETEVLLALTSAVATAALGDAALATLGQSWAAAALAEAQRTVARRRRRETQALAGRTGGMRTARSSMTARLKAFCDSSERYAVSVALLGSGPAVLRLRSEVVADGMYLFDDGHPLSAYPREERSLIKYLDEGFEATWPTQDAQSMRALTQSVAALFREATAEMLHEPPEGRGEARRAWNDAAREVRTTLRKMLQREVRTTLA